MNSKRESVKKLVKLFGLDPKLNDLFMSRLVRLNSCMLQNTGMTCE